MKFEKTEEDLTTKLKSEEDTALLLKIAQIYDDLEDKRRTHLTTVQYG